MSEKNGDKARYQRERKKKNLQRKHARDLRTSAESAAKQEAPQAAPPQSGPAEV